MTQLLPPTLRGKKRYIAFKIHSDHNVRRDEAVGTIWHTVLSFLGEKEAAELGLWIKDYEKNQGFMVCSNKKTDTVIGTLALVDEISYKKASIQVLGVSGTLKALKRKFLEKQTVETKKTKEKIELQGKEMAVVRKQNNRLDAVTEDYELKKRLTHLKIDYIGLTEEDLL